MTYTPPEDVSSTLLFLTQNHLLPKTHVNHHAEPRLMYLALHVS